MAFFTTLTLSSLSSMFKFAISLRSSSLSRLLEKQNMEKKNMSKAQNNRSLTAIQKHPPCFLDKADDKLSYFDGFVRLKGDYLLKGEEEEKKKASLHNGIMI